MRHDRIFFTHAKVQMSKINKLCLLKDSLPNFVRSRKKEGLTITDEFVEKRTAKMPGRQIFNEMITRIQKGEAQGIICWKLDRLARNPVDGGQISWVVQQSIIQHILTHDKSYYSSDIVLMMFVEFGMANQFIRDLSTNVKRGLRAKVKRGEFSSTAPTGYLNDTRKRTIVVDRKKSKVIREAFELYSQGERRHGNLYLLRMYKNKKY